jgi:hypothetical protein
MSWATAKREEKTKWKNVIKKIERLTLKTAPVPIPAIKKGTAVRASLITAT